MKKYLLQSFVFILFAILIYGIALVVWQHSFPYILKPNLTYKIGSYGHMFSRIKEAKINQNVDVLFVGSSHAYRGFDTRIFKANGFQTFNLGSSSQTPIQTYILLKRYLKTIHPKLIVFEVNPISFSSDGVESSLDIIANDKNDCYSVEMALKVNNIKTYNALIYGFESDWLGLNKSFHEASEIDGDTYISGGFVERKMSFYHPEKINKTPVVFQKKQTEAFKKCLDEIKKNNIDLLLVFAPVSPNLYSSYPNIAVFDSTLSTQGNYINFNTKLSLNDSLHFYDSHHLNQSGVTLFNTAFIKLLNERRK